MVDEKQMTQEEMLAAQKQNCIFCKIIKKEIPSKIVHTDKICTAILDINPANEGHILLIPNEHYSIMPQVPEETIAHMAVISKKISKSLLISTMGKSTSIFIANGAAAGQKAPHFMIHIIPRKTPQEFFKIPNNEINPKELDSLQKILIQKLNHLLGIKHEENNHGIINQEKTTELPKKNIESIEYESTNNQTNHTITQNQSFNSQNDKKIFKSGIKKEPGYLYFVDEEGDISRVKMARGRVKKGEKSKKEKVLQKEKSEEIEETIEETETFSDSKKEVTLDDISNLLLGGRK